jgi:hypothetical protein
MRVRQWMRWMLLLISVTASMRCGGCRGLTDKPQALTPERRTEVEDSARKFMAAVAHDVTQDGPLAWRKFFADRPAFFMAVNGQMAFPSGQAAAQAIPEIAKKLKRIELHWGDDLRLDPLTESLCAVGASYTEVIEVQPGGAEEMQGTHRGYFTGVAENRNGKWQFRDVHWSEVVPPAPAKAP